MNRRVFLKVAGFSVAGAGAAGAAVTAAGCMAPRVSPSVAQSTAPPWRCSHCGHLTRSGDDLSGARCPRCKRKQVLKRISEDALKEYLAKENVS